MLQSGMVVTQDASASVGVKGVPPPQAQEQFAQLVMKRRQPFPLCALGPGPVASRRRAGSYVQVQNHARTGIQAPTEK